MYRFILPLLNFMLSFKKVWNMSSETVQNFPIVELIYFKEPLEGNNLKCESILLYQKTKKCPLDQEINILWLNVIIYGE